MGFKLKIVTPEKVFFEGEVDILNIKLTKGYTGILPKHMPLVSMVEIAPMNFKQGKITREMAVHGGVLNVKEDETLLLVNAIEYKEDIDIEVKVPDRVLMVPVDARLIEQVIINLLENIPLSERSNICIINEAKSFFIKMKEINNIIIGFFKIALTSTTH